MNEIPNNNMNTHRMHTRFQTQFDLINKNMLILHNRNNCYEANQAVLIFIKKHNVCKIQSIEFVHK